MNNVKEPNTNLNGISPSDLNREMLKKLDFSEVPASVFGIEGVSNVFFKSGDRVIVVEAECLASTWINPAYKYWKINLDWFLEATTGATQKQQNTPANPSL